MMYRLLLSLSLLLSGLLTPMAAAAYVSPEEMLDDGDFSTRFLDPPPTSPRDYERVAAEQAAEIAAAREAERQKIIGNGLPETTVAQEDEEDEQTHAAAEEQTDLEKLLSAIKAMEEEDGTTDLRDARILERIKAQQEQDRLQAQLQWISQTQSLHGGAPLMSDTGPATAGAVLLLIGTVGWILRRARKMEKR